MSKTLKDLAIIDYESLPARDKPRGPPVPVGVAVRVPGEKSEYLAFGHPSGNTHTWEQAQRRVAKIYEQAENGRPIGAHNDKFEQDVGEHHLNLKRLPWDAWHDTQPMLFLKNPHAPSFKLKDSAERELGEPPTERDAMVDWLVENQPIPNLTLSDKPKSKNYAGAYVAYAPVKLAAPYAIGDVDRTYRLAQPLHKFLREHSMLDAYDRERRLMPAQLEMENQGMRVDVERLGRDVERYTAQLAAIDKWIGKRCRAEGINVDSSAELGNALVKAGLATLGKTKNGQWEVNKDALEAGITDKQVLRTLKYRAKLCTSLRTFMRPWYDVARLSGGVVFTNWLSTRQDRGGARTGRFSSTPNFQNLPKEFEPLFYHEVMALEPKEKAKHKLADYPKAPIQLLPLPNIRSYVIPWDDDHVLIDRDYSQQELRILAHYEGKAMLQAYLTNPWLDHHENARTLINNLLKANFERKPIKNTGFGLIYGMGVGLLAEKSKTTVELAKKVKDAYLAVFPGLRDIYDEMKRRAQTGEPIRTWGGREYYCEEPRIIDGRLRHFDYKLVNVLIQGSAADCTKEALIRFHAAKSASARIYLSAHDELLVSVRRREWREQMEILRHSMESVQFDVPMLSEGAVSDVSWADLKTHDKAGKVIFVDFSSKRKTTGRRKAA